MQLQQRWQVCVERFEPIVKKSKARVSKMLSIQWLQLRVLLEGCPTGPHGRALRSSRTIEQPSCGQSLRSSSSGNMVCGGVYARFVCPGDLVCW
jgi:hypothetical protein